jgi:hypothetical protein
MVALEALLVRDLQQVRLARVQVRFRWEFGVRVRGEGW